jgi:hypothetical protein
MTHRSFVMPVKTGIQGSGASSLPLDPGLREGNGLSYWYYARHFESNTQIYRIFQVPSGCRQLFNS